MTIRTTRTNIGLLVYRQKKKNNNKMMRIVNLDFCGMLGWLA